MSVFLRMPLFISALYKGTPKGTRLVFLRGRGSPTKDERRAAPSERLADALSRGIVHVGIIYGLPLRPERKAGVGRLQDVQDLFFSKSINIQYRVCPNFRGYFLWCCSGCCSLLELKSFYSPKQGAILASSRTIPADLYPHL